METSEYGSMYEVEDRHWWFRAKRSILRSLLRKELRDGAVLLDFGCGTGAFLREVQAGVTVHGVDVAEEAIRFCRERGLENVRLLTPEWWESSRGSYDIIVASDVLEHIEDDVEILQRLHRALRPGGLLVITVPACPFLWSSHDVALHHKRRYTKATLRGMAGAAGLEWSRIGYYSSFLFPPIAGIRVLRKWLGAEGGSRSDSVKMPGRLVNGLLSMIFEAEKYVLRYTSFPCGVSLFAMLRKAA